MNKSEYEIKTEEGYLTDILYNGKSIKWPGVCEVSVDVSCDTRAMVTLKGTATDIKYVSEDYND